VVSLTLSKPTASSSEGIRPVNVKTDLAPLADLIELAFADTMDSSGRAAIRELRTLSRFGTGLGMLAGMNDLVQGIGLGYVWIQDERLVGNVSIYSANVPADRRQTWIIANVAVHPEYRGRGIARRLMQTSLEAIAKRGATRSRPVNAILQVEQNNLPARKLYDSLGFVQEGTWKHWRRSTGTRLQPLEHSPYLTQRRRGEWRAEYALAQRIRPHGLGWQRPLHPGLFHRSLATALSDLINMRSFERLVVRSEDEKYVRASLWIERAFAAASVQLMLLVDPDYQGAYDEALVHLAVQRYGARSPLALEHPADDSAANALLERYHFRVQRSLVHMRWQSQPPR
jgi:ribosomal protein S18 acetylase RimI-like enzyme